MKWDAKRSITILEMRLINNMSANSGRKINYAVRPAKNVERKMMRDIFLRMRTFNNLKNFTYVGFGSRYFTDFSLFHKFLHIEKMISIEQDQNKERYVFNKPFSCIDIRIGKSTDLLPRLDFKENMLFWLDYDDMLNATVLNDVALLFENCRNASFISISFNSHPYQLTESERATNTGDQLSDKEMLIKKLAEQVDEELIPRDLPEKGLRKNSVFAEILRQIVVNKIESTVSKRNASLLAQEKWAFQQVLNFSYKDGAHMTTLGWVIFQERDRGKFDEAGMTDLDFFRGGDEPYEIAVPNLTIRELNYLKQLMPIDQAAFNFDAELPNQIFERKDVENFAKIYKYFPNFTEIENV